MQRNGGWRVRADQGNPEAVCPRSRRRTLAMLKLPRSSCVRAACAAFLTSTLAFAASSLPGFTLAGESWTYDPGDGGPLIVGRLVQPTVGSAPHPAVLISHGQGGNAAGFVTQKANVMKTWGLVCIGPDYTHVNTSYAVGTDGWSAENERRARACLTILASLGTVDMTRVAAYGNSKGAFLTAGLCGAVAPGTLRCAAITAGGTSGSTITTSASPALQEVQGITAPMLLLHGSADTTVFPIQSETLANVLAANGIPFHRYVWEGVSHNLHADRASEVYTLMRAWFSEHGVLGSAGDTPPVIGAPFDVAVQAGEHVGPLAFAVGGLTFFNLVMLILGLAVMNVFVITLGVHCGLHYANSRHAIGVSLGNVFFLCLGVVTLMLLLISFSGSFQVQYAPFTVFIVGGGVGIFVSLGIRNPSGAIALASGVLPIATFFAVTSFLVAHWSDVFLVTVAAYGFAIAAMLIPALSGFDVALGRSRGGNEEQWNFACEVT